MKRIAILALLMCGCATIVAPSSETIEIASETRAIIRVDGQSHTAEPGRPVKVALGTDTTHTVTFPDGTDIEIERTLSGWYWGNILFGGIIGLVIDPITGAWMNNLEPDHLLWKDGQIWNAENNVQLGLKSPPKPTQVAGGAGKVDKR